jgi:hypothetical protein
MHLKVTVIDILLPTLYDAVNFIQVIGYCVE